ncbi:MMPL family transporter [bacterium]|nr:MMPL family transporter [bacterium]
MTPGQAMVRCSVDHPKIVAATIAALTIVLGAFIPLVKVDTDPENMLSEKAPVRVFHNAMKREFTLNDMVVVGIVNESDPDGVFNPDSLKKVYDLTGYAKTLRWPDPKDPAKEIGVITIDLLAPSTVDNIEQAGPGTVRFEWLMAEPPKTREEARAIRDKARRNPLLDGTLLSEDGKALCLYLPLTSKDLSYRVYKALKQKIKTLRGPEQYHITGLPVAEDTFGVEMFIQMAISAPLAMLVIFLLMYAFFRNTIVVLSTLIDAMISVVCTMGLLIATGHTVHIMSSMIPIFIMPMAVLDDVHVLSEFFDRYQKTRDRRATLLGLIDELFMPMLYTTLTTAAGFAALALTPIPPVQVFGVFVAIGVIVAWVCSMMVVPAYLMLLPNRVLENFGSKHHDAAQAKGLARMLPRLGQAAYRGAKPILAVTVVLAAVAAYGIAQIQINDNPVKWFAPTHDIRVADRVLNEHFGGTYMAYLALEGVGGEGDAAGMAAALEARLDAFAKELEGADAAEAAPVIAQARTLVRDSAGKPSGAAVLDAVLAETARQAEKAGEAAAFFWGDLGTALEAERMARQTFKRPEVLRYLEELQAALLETGVVGKSSSVADAVKKVSKELLGGDWKHHRVPDSPAAVAQFLMQYQSGNDPDDLWHLVTRDFSKANVWVQLKSGDNRDMEKVVAALDAFVAANEPPVALERGWFGLTYINVEWQNRMVSGMLQAFLGSFLIVFVMMTVLFRSPLWGILSMIPLTVTIALIYGVIGLVGKDYDMPVAVLSSLTLGLAVDFAIHFLARSRAAVAEAGSWSAAAGPVFGEPARAITRNIIVIAVGFTPLLLAPLVPYQTVGMLMAAILAVSGLATLFVLPALLRLLEKRLFRGAEPMAASCNCAVCFSASAATVALVALSIHQYTAVGWSTLTWASACAVPVLALICGRLSRRQACRQTEGGESE